MNDDRDEEDYAFDTDDHSDDNGDDVNENDDDGDDDETYIGKDKNMDNDARFCRKRLHDTDNNDNEK